MAQQFRPVVEVEGQATPLHCLRLSLSQAIFDHHHFEVVVPYETLEGTAGNGLFVQAHHALCGKRVTISLAPVVPGQPTPAFRFTGIITQLRLGSTHDLSSVYFLEGFSPTYLLEDSVQRRTFVKQTLPQISQQVLANYPDNLLEREIAPRFQSVLPYSVQYDENSFSFLKRLASTRGEWLYYTGTRLVLGPAATTSAVPFVLGGTQSFTLSVSLRPTTFKVTDYNYRQHQSMQDTSAGQPAARQGTLAEFAAQASEQLFPQAFSASLGQPSRTPDELRTAASQLKTNLTGSLVVFEGVGETPNITLGGLIKVQQPATETRTAADLGEYRVLAIDHWLDDVGNYMQKFRAIPAGSGADPVPWIAPVAGAMELAEVIDLDDPRQLGRVRVRFQWPVANPTAAESGWLRVSTPYSGNGKGHLFVPEAGSQVLVGYEQGQAELPVVLGNLFHVHNPQQATYTRSDNHLKGMQTAGGNKFVMSEVAGAQSILLSNSNKKGTSILVSFQGDGSVSITTNGPVHITSGDTISLDAKKDIALRAGGDITLAADKNILAETKDESIGIRAKKELLLTATDDELSLEASSKKLVAKSADNVELSAGAVAKIMGADIKWSKS